MRTKLLLAVATVLSIAASPALAQDYPTKPVNIIVAAPAGGGIDVAARLVAEELHKKWGQPVVVENRQGGGGNVGADALARANPDGYTIMVSGPAPLTINRLIYGSLTFDPDTIVPVAILNTIPNTIVVSNKLGLDTMEAFVEKAKAAPDTISYASQGIGTTPHLGAELLQSMAGIELVHVPYRGTAPAVTDIMAGHVDMMFMQLESALRLHHDGTGKILAVSSAERLAELPEVQTLIELGYEGFVSDTWNAVTAPPGTPDELVSFINGAINEAIALPAVAERFSNLGMHPVGGSAQDMVDYLAVERERWGKVVVDAGIKVTE